MASVKFNLRSKNNSKPQPIYLIFRDKKEKLTYSTGFKVLPEHWSDSKERIKNIYLVENRNEINSFLDDLQSELLSKATDLKRERKPITKDVMKAHLNLFTGRDRLVDNNLLGFIQSFIKGSKDRLNPKTGKKISKLTIKKYKTSYSKLERFAKYKGIELQFSNLNLDFYLDYKSYLTKELNHATNTIGKEISTLKVFLNDATDKGVNTNMTYKSHRVNAPTEYSEAVALTENELQALEKLDLSTNKRLETVKDMFIVGCWTGCRFSDLMQLSENNIKGNFIHIDQQKTGNHVAIPLRPIVKQIIEKYNYKLPRISNQRFNEYIKEVCKLAEIDTYETKSITKGGIRRATRYHKYELVSSHTARRTFASILYRSGFPSISIMNITGHKTEKEFLKYIKVTPEEHAKLLLTHWTKTGSLLTAN